MASPIEYNKENVKLMSMIGLKFANDVLQLYSTLMRRIGGSKDEGLKRDLNVEKERAEYISDLVEKINDPSRTSFPEKEVDELIKEMKIAEEKLNRLIADAENDISLQAKLDKIVFQKGLDAKKISKSINMARGRIDKVSLPGAGTFNKMKELMPDMFSGMASAGEDVAKQMLGPLGELGVGAFKGVSGMFSKMRDRKKTLEQQSFEGSMLNANKVASPFSSFYSGAQGGVDLLSKIFGGFSGGGSSAGTAGKKPGTGKAGAGQTVGNVVSKLFSGGGVGTAGPMGGVVTPKTINDGLWMFFDGSAMHARWTKSLLNAVKNIGKKEHTLGEKAVKAKGWWEVIKLGLLALGPKIVAFFAGVGTAILSALAGLGPAIGIALGAAALIAAGVAADWAIGKFAGKDAQKGVRVAGPMGFGTAIGKKLADAVGWGKPKEEKSKEGVQVGESAAKVSDSSSSTHSDKTSTSVIDNLKESFSNKIESATSAVKETKVPIASPIGVGMEAAKSEMLQKTLISLIDEVKKIAKPMVATMPLSGFNAFNIRNPLLSAMSSGGVEIDE